LDEIEARLRMGELPEVRESAHAPKAVYFSGEPIGVLNAGLSHCCGRGVLGARPCWTVDRYQHYQKGISLAQLVAQGLLNMLDEERLKKVVPK
jgi:hypothetical protein